MTAAFCYKREWNKREFHMLEKMILILTEGYKKKLETSDGYSAFIEQMQIHGTIVQSWECKQWKNEVVSNDSIWEKKETPFTLYLSDNGEVLGYLQDKGRYTIAVYHSEVKGILPGTQYAIEGIEDVEWDFYDKVYQRFEGEPWKITETARCIIREMGIDDVDDLYELYRSPLVTRYTETLFSKKDQERQYIQDYVENIYKYYGFGIWLIYGKEDGKLIGRAGFNYRPGFEEVELGFVIGEAYWHKGYAYEVCCHLLELGKSVYEFEKVQALVRKENEASIRLLKKLGFAYVEDVMLDGQEYARYLS